MVTGPPLLLVISMPNSLGLGFVRLPSDTVVQSGFVGANGVGVGIGVKVGVDVGGTGVGGMGEAVCVGARTGVKVRGARDGVHEGSTKPVLDGANVSEGTGVRVSVGMEVGVKVISD